jgi:hypothetical protein
VADEDEELDQAATVEEALRILLTRRLRDRFPGLGLTEKGARALAGAVVPNGESVLVVEERRSTVYVALAPRPRTPGRPRRRCLG